MARTDNIEIRLRLLGARDVARGADKASRSIRGLSTNVDKMGKRHALAAQGVASARRGISAVGTAAKWTGIAVGGLAIYEIPRLLRATREAEKANRNVASAIRSSGGEANVTARHIDRLAGRMMIRNGIDDETIKNTAALLLTFRKIRNVVGANEATFDRTLQTTADMAARFGTDMPNAAKQLAKALQDPETALSALRRSGATFTDEEKDRIVAMFDAGKVAKAQGVILDELAKETKGAAASQTDSVDRMRLKWGELEETGGKLMMPLFNDIVDEADEAVSKVSKILGSKKLTGKQKFNRVMGVIEGVLEKGIDKLEEHLPEIAETGARLGGRLAMALGRAFLRSDWLGKLFIGGWIVGKLLGTQGLKLLAVVGFKAGQAFARRFILVVGSAMVSTEVGAGLLGTYMEKSPKVQSFMSRWGARMGRAFALGFLTLGGVEIVKEIHKKFDNVNPLNPTPDIDNPGGGLPGGLDIPTPDLGGVVDTLNPFGKRTSSVQPISPSGITRGGSTQTIEVPLYLDGKLVAAAVAKHASNAAARA